MAEETIIADEQTDVDVQEESEVDDSQEETTDVEAIKAELAKEKAEREKWENRYKSTKKKESNQPKEQPKKEGSQESDLNSVVEKKIAEFQEKESFKKTYGEDIFQDTAKIKDQHPTLSWEEAMKLSPIANDPARAANPEADASPGRPNMNAINKTKFISQEAHSKMEGKAFVEVLEKIKS